MRLPDPGNEYDRSRQGETQRILEREDSRNRKRDQDIELAAERLILRSPNGTRYKITVDNAGNIGTEAL